MARLARTRFELPILETNFTLTVVDDQSEYTISNFGVDQRDIIGVREVRNTTSAWRMSRFPWVEYKALSTQAEGSPIRWARHGNLLAVDPEPDDEYDLLIEYRRRPTLDTLDDFDNEWHEQIVNIATWIGWQALALPLLANATAGMIPMEVRRSIEVPLAGADWEAEWDDELGLAPRDAGMIVG